MSIAKDKRSIRQSFEKADWDKAKSLFTEKYNLVDKKLYNQLFEKCAKHSEDEMVKWLFTFKGLGLYAKTVKNCFFHAIHRNNPYMLTFLLLSFELRNFGKTTFYKIFHICIQNKQYVCLDTLLNRYFDEDTMGNVFFSTIEHKQFGMTEFIWRSYSRIFNLAKFSTFGVRQPKKHQARAKNIISTCIEYNFNYKTEIIRRVSRFNDIQEELNFDFPKTITDGICIICYETDTKQYQLRCHEKHVLCADCFNAIDKCPIDDTSFF